MRIRGYAPATPCWAELATCDPATATGFYQALFGWDAVPVDGGPTVFTLRELATAGVMPAPDGQPAGWLTYMSTEDISATTEAVTNGGGTVLRPPAELGARGQLAMFRDAEGAVFAVWQRGTFSGAQVANEPNTVCWSDLATRDQAGAATFYGKVFGWVDQPGGVASTIEYREWVVSNRVVGGMSAMDERYPAEVPAHWRTTFEVDDCAGLAARGVELGGQLAVGPLDVGVGQYAMLVDPLGASFGVIELIPELRMPL